MTTLVNEFPPCPQAPSTPLSPHLTWVVNSGPNTLISSSSVCNSFQMFLTKDPPNCSKAVQPQMSPPFKGSHQPPCPPVPGVASASSHLPSTSHMIPTTPTSRAPHHPLQTQTAHQPPPSAPSHSPQVEGDRTQVTKCGRRQ